MTSPYPFSAIQGQEDMKLALQLSAIDASIGGVLVFGDRGTGKSTAIRGLAALMPKVPMVLGCPYNCDPDVPRPDLCIYCELPDVKGKRKVKPQQLPVVDLPLGATEDRVIGALDLEKALHQGEKAFEPGLLARAHRGFLYIDEVNLLEDHLVDALLDVAASGENVVEREGLSIRHPAKFVLVGSGNPEEGELRPQLLDRFGLSVDVRTPKDIDTRVKIVQLRDEFERDSIEFVKAWRRKDGVIRRKIEKARGALNKVEVPIDALESAARLCMALGTDGLRGELTLVRASRALAAFSGKKVVDTEHLRAVAPMVLRHRLRRDPLDESGSDIRVQRALEENLD